MLTVAPCGLAGVVEFPTALCWLRLTTSNKRTWWGWWPSVVRGSWIRVVLFCCILGCLLFLICIEFVHSVFSCAVWFVGISQVIGCENLLRNDLYCVERGVKVNSTPTNDMLTVQNVPSDHACRPGHVLYLFGSSSSSSSSDKSTCPPVHWCDPA